MILCGIAYLLIASSWPAQTAGSAAPSISQDDIKVITAQANQGDAEAQLKLGDAYLRGRGVTQNGAEAIRWFRASAEKGNAEAQYVLGNLYEVGIALRQDDAEATKWFLTAASRGTN